MLAHDVQQVEQVWPTVKEVIYYPHTEAEYNRLVSMLDSLVDTIGEDESHPLTSLMEVISILIEKYEDEHVPELT